MRGKEYSSGICRKALQGAAVNDQSGHGTPGPTRGLSSVQQSRGASRSWCSLIEQAKSLCSGGWLPLWSTESCEQPPSKTLICISTSEPSCPLRLWTRTRIHGCTLDTVCLCRTSTQTTRC